MCSDAFRNTLHYEVRYHTLVNPPSNTTGERVASEVRRRRLQRDWTLDTAAARLGISRRLLAQVEAGQANPSLSTLLSIASGFDVSLVELLAVADKPAITVQDDNAGAPQLWSGPRGGQARLLVASEPLELWRWVLEPGEERRSDAHRPGAREALLVEVGAVTIAVGAGEPVTVRAGQSALFPSDEPHRYRNDSDAAASFVLAVHDPSGVAR